LAVRIYTDKDVDLRGLRSKTCAVIGFGAQGHAHALNLHDSGLRVIVGLRARSKSRSLAKRHGLSVFTTSEAVKRADVIFVALPDTSMPTIFKREIAPSLRRGQTLLFAHGFAVFYRTIVPPNDVDVVMVAPKGLGTLVRREYINGRGVPALAAVYQDFSGNALHTAMSWAKGIGSARAGIIRTTFREETETDMFGEQAVLCGGVTSLIKNAFETLVRAGYPRELAYFECLHELKFIVDLIHERGIAGMTALISDTAKWGELTVGPRIVDASTRKRMVAALRNIQNGKFAREFIREMDGPRRKYAKLLRNNEEHPIEGVGRRLRALMSWREKTKPR
jgi:ketol-acid reductoisomerase